MALVTWLGVWPTVYVVSNLVGRQLSSWPSFWATGFVTFLVVSGSRLGCDAYTCAVAEAVAVALSRHSTKGKETSMKTDAGQGIQEGLEDRAGIIVQAAGDGDIQPRVGRARRPP